MAQKNNRIGNDLGLRTVLIARFTALGDVVTALPVVYSACMCYPDVRFVMLTSLMASGLFVNPPANLTVIGTDINGQHRSFKSLWKLMGSINAEYHIDAFIDLHNVMRTRLMQLYCRLHGIACAKIYNGGKNALTRQSNKVMLPLPSARARYRDAFYRAGLPVESKFDGLYGPGKADPHAFADITAPRTDKSQLWIGIAPFAAYRGKEYPPEKMIEVVRMLTDKYPCRIFIFGGTGRERKLALQMADLFPQITVVAGEKHGFSAELALLSHLDVMLTMDSANMHMAAIAGTPTVSVWGATHVYCGFKGWHQAEADTVQLPLSCRPCSVTGAKACHRHDYLCIQAIRPDMIFNKVEEVLCKK